MKKLRTILLTTAMAAAMTTGAFAATCPTTTSPINYGTGAGARQIQALNLSNFKNSFNLKSTNLSDLCKELKLTDWYSQISKCSDSNGLKKSCVESNRSNCNLSDSCKNGTQADTCTPAVGCKPNACKPVEDDKTPVKPPVDTQKPPVDTEKPPVDTEKPPVDTEKPPVDTEESKFVAEVVRLVNVERKNAGLNELTVDSKISAAALVRSKEQVQSFSHTRPDGTSCFTALKEQGVTYRGAGENIAMGQRTPAEVMEGWMNSPGHKANILNANFTKIGVGYFKTNGRAYWTQMFTY